jgi:hypothetical protein
MLVIPATWEVEIGLQFKASLEKKFARPYLKNKVKRAGGVAQAVEHLSRKYEALSSKPQYYHQKKKNNSEVK